MSKEVNFAVQYTAHSVEAFNTYQKECAPALQQEFVERWGAKAAAFRTFCQLFLKEKLVDIRAKKHLGQHFLTDPGIAQRIAESITLHNGCNTVVEVGPETGALTKPLIARGDLIYT